jgi:hypothetical protein
VSAVAQEVVRPEPRSSVTGAALGPVELTVVTAWADALAAALEHAPETSDDVLADALPGAPWRRQLGVPEPSATLVEALTAVADTLGATTADGDRVDALVTLLRDAAPDGTAAASLARAVLRAAMEARRDARAVRARTR